MAHPQTNGEAEVTNRTLLQGIKTRLDKAKGAWVDELYHVLWAYRTTQRVPTGETPFALAFGTEAVIPVELKLSSARVVGFNEQHNPQNLRVNLDLLEEKREEPASGCQPINRRWLGTTTPGLKVRRSEWGT